ncbi:MAG: hypothetical protein CMO81_11465 [Waddliaceae bacterium]|nr:hypothetical protein [Waddliaceae bacterium]
MKGYHPFSGKKAPCGYAYQGFINEVDIGIDGEPDILLDIRPIIDLFFSYYPGPFPELEQWMNAWRHHIGPPHLYFLPKSASAVMEGFRCDFHAFYNPPSLAHHDLNIGISEETLLWNALRAFLAHFKSEKPMTTALFFETWHNFLTVKAVIYKASAECADYAPHELPSYQEVYWSCIEEDHRIEDFQKRLNIFAEHCISEYGYFLPSHHYDEWLELMEHICGTPL